MSGPLPIRQGATHKVVVGPAVAVADGFTPVTSLAASTADEAEAILHNSGTVIDISAYTWSAITTADGYYHLTLQSAICSVVGHLTIVINDDSVCLPLRTDFVVMEESTYDALYASGATALTGTNVASAVWTFAASGAAFSTVGSHAWAYPTRILTASTNFTIPTASAVASQVWSYPTAGTKAASTIASQVWSYPTAGTKAASNIATQVWQTVGSTTAHQTIVSGVWNHGTRVLTASTNFTIPTAAAIASAVWTFAASGAAFSTIASHVWAQKESVTIATGGFPVGGYAAGAVTAAAIAADAITSSELASTAAEKIADAFLNRDLAGGASGDTRNVRNAFRMLRNRVDASTGTVYAENDSTAAWSFAVSTAAGNPIVAIDPD